MLNFPISYLNGGYSTIIYADGTKIRETISSEPPLLPSSIDLKITQYCDAGCSYCHENSTIRGSDEIQEEILERLGNMLPGTEIAVGGGDPTSSKNLPKIRDFFESRGVISSITVNHKHWNNFYNSEMFKIFYGVGLSVGENLPLGDPVENVVLHFINGIHDPDLACRALERGWKILILGYKRWGRGAKVWNAAVEDNKALWYRQLFRLANVLDAKIAFDTLGVEQLQPHRMFKDRNDYAKYFMGEEGQHSMYVDLVKGEYARSSFDKQRFKFDRPLKDVFEHVRGLV